MKRLYCVLSMLIVAILSFGCAAQKPMTAEEIAAERERQLQMITRIYEDKTPQEVLLAADQVFRLADDDYNVSHPPVSLSAQRRWGLYLVLAFTAGTDTWNVSTETLPAGGTKVMVAHSGQESSVFAGPVGTSAGGTSATAVTTPGMQNITTRPAIYQLFFARLDYLLGKRKDWPTCKEAGDLFTDGHLDPFCTVANDRTPDGKSAAQRRTERESAKEDKGASLN